MVQKILIRRSVPAGKAWELMVFSASENLGDEYKVYQFG
jgi:hypothetical protein